MHKAKPDERPANKSARIAILVFDIDLRCSTPVDDHAYKGPREILTMEVIEKIPHIVVNISRGSINLVPAKQLVTQVLYQMRNEDVAQCKS